MVMPAHDPHPLDTAAAIGRRLAASAIVADRRATWLIDETVTAADAIRRRARTLNAGLASGTAGVGWTLARIASAAGDAAMARVAVAALHQSLAALDRLIAERDLGFHDGASGVVWAAADADRVLGGTDLQDDLSPALARIADAARCQPADDLESGLARGLAGLVTGLVALWSQTRETTLLDAAHPSVRGLCERVRQWVDAGVPLPRAQVGLLNGASGIGAALLSWPADRDDAREAAEAAFRLERPWHDDRFGWFGGDAARPHSWSDGAAGIGLARVWGYAATGELVHLAEAGAALATLRAVAAAEIRREPSLGLGAAGHMELLISAGSVLEQRAHLDAARRTVPRVLAVWHDAFPPAAPVFDPTLLRGAAGVAVTLLRLHDPAGVPSPLLPPLRVIQRATAGMPPSYGPSV